TLVPLPGKVHCPKAANTCSGCSSAGPRRAAAAELITAPASQFYPGNRQPVPVGPAFQPVARAQGRLLRRSNQRLPERPNPPDALFFPGGRTGAVRGTFGAGFRDLPVPIGPGRLFRRNPPCVVPGRARFADG